MENINENVSVEYLPSLGFLENHEIKSSSVDPQTEDNESVIIRMVEDARKSYENENSISNIKSFDDILLDIIESSKKHMSNQNQLNPSDTTPASSVIAPLNPSENAYTNLINITENTHSLCSTPQEMDFYPPNPIDYSLTNQANNISFENSETLIETVYKDSNNTINVSNNDYCINDVKDGQISNISQINLELSQPVNCESIQEDVFQKPYEIEILPTLSLSLQETNQLNNENFETLIETGYEDSNNTINVSNNDYCINDVKEGQISNISQINLELPQPVNCESIQEDVFQKPFEIEILPSLSLNLPETNQLNNNLNDVKVIYSNDICLENDKECNGNPTNITSVLNQQNYLLPNEDQKHTLPQNYTHLIQPAIIQQTQNSNKSDITVQINSEPTNIFFVADVNFQPQWVIQQRYVAPNMISVRPPVQIRHVVQKAEDDKIINDLKTIDFSFYDTSNIIVPTIKVKSPSHKKRKQDFEIKTFCENIDYQSTDVINELDNNKVELSENEDSSELTTKVDSIDPFTSNKNKISIINDDSENKEIEKNLDILLEENTEVGIKDKKILKTSNTEKNELPTVDVGFLKKDDFSESDCGEKESVEIKVLKCLTDNENKPVTNQERFDIDDKHPFRNINFRKNSKNFNQKKSDPNEINDENKLIEKKRRGRKRKSVANISDNDKNDEFKKSNITQKRMRRTCSNIMSYKE